MWCETHARSPLATQNVLFCSAPQASSGAGAGIGSASRAGHVPTGAPEHQRPRPSGDSDRAGHRVVGAGLDRAVVDEEQVGDRRQARPARPRRGRRSARRRRCRSSSPAGRRQSAEQQVMQRRVGQHHAELGQAPGATDGGNRRPGRRDRQHDRPRHRIQQRARLRPRSISSPAAAASATISANGLSSRCLRARSAATACSSARVADQVVAAEPLDGDDRALGQPGGGEGDADRSRRRVSAGCTVTHRARATRGPHAGQALGCAWKRRSTRILVLAPARLAHDEAGHRRQRPVIGHAGDDREPRPAVGAVDERIAVAAVRGIGQLGEAVRRTAPSRATTSASAAPGALAGADRELPALRPAAATRASTASTEASGGASARRRASRTAPPTSGSPSTSSSTPCSSLSTYPARPSSGRAGRRTAGSRRPGRCPATRARVRTGGVEAPASQLDQLAQQVVGGRLRLLDARDVLRRGDDHVVGEPVGRDPAAVVADERDRRPGPGGAPRARPRARSASCRSSRARAARRRRGRRR